MDHNGTWQSTPAGIEDVVIWYFQDLFAHKEPNLAAHEVVLHTIQLRVSPAMNQTLLEPYITKEVKAALFQMHPSKAPGPDGMSPFFFQKYWDLIGNEIASKVLAKRLKSFLPAIISPEQSALVPDRLISDNTLVASELAHYMHKLRRGQEGFMSVKLDISKAYDRCGLGLDWIWLPNQSDVKWLSVVDGPVLMSGTSWLIDDGDQMLVLDLEVELLGAGCLVSSAKGRAPNHSSNYSQISEIFICATLGKKRSF
ncbi:hypothetical protein ACLB2K_026540 [Fragaria x ananassa]